MPGSSYASPSSWYDDQRHRVGRPQGVRGDGRVVLGVAAGVALGHHGDGAVGGARVDVAAEEVLLRSTSPPAPAPRPGGRVTRLPQTARWSSSTQTEDVAVGQGELDAALDLARQVRHPGDVARGDGGAAPEVEPVRTAAVVASATITPVMRDMTSP